jgi:hypothetical protein
LEKTYSDGREVHENVLTPIVGRDRAVAFCRVEQLDLAFNVCGGECEAYGTSGEGELGEVHFVYWCCFLVRLSESLERLLQAENRDQ